MFNVLNPFVMFLQLVLLQITFHVGSYYYQWRPKELRDVATNSWQLIEGTIVRSNEHLQPGDKHAANLKFIPNGAMYSTKWSRYFHDLSDAVHEQIKKEAQDKAWEAEKEAKRESTYKNLTPEEAEIARKRDVAAAAAEQRNKSEYFVSEELRMMIDFVKEIFPEHLDKEMKDVPSDEGTGQHQPKKRTVYKNKSENWNNVTEQNMRGQEMKDVRAQSKYQYIFGKRYGARA
jgi:hypothetical protein